MAKEKGRSDSGRREIEHEMLICLPRLNRFAMWLTRDAPQAEDLVQQTILQGLTHLDQFEPGTNMVAWLSTIMQNRFIGDCRRRKRQEQGWQPEFDNSLKFSTGLAATDMEVREDYRRILSHLGHLPLHQRDALIAVAYLGMSYEEAAQRLGCALGTIRSRVCRGRRGLKGLMQRVTPKENGGGNAHTEARRNVSRNDPYFPIAEAYKELNID